MAKKLKRTAYKIFAILLVLCMAVVPNAIFVMANDGVPVITGGTASAQPGEVVEVVFTITQNPGLGLMSMVVIWDDRLTDVEISTAGSALPGLIVLPEANYQRRITFFSFTGDIYANGTLFTVRATIASGTPPGAIPLQLVINDINNSALTLNVVPALNNGEITIDSNNNQSGLGGGGTTPPPQGPGMQLPPYLPDSSPDFDITPGNISNPQSPEETGAVGQADGRIVRFRIGSVVYTVNGIHFTNDVAPFIDRIYSRTMIPLRAVSEALDAEVEWICQARTVQIFTAAGMQTLTVDTPLPDGMGIPVIVQDRVFVPLYFVAGLLDAQARWDGANSAAYVYM